LQRRAELANAGVLAGIAVKQENRCHGINNTRKESMDHRSVMSTYET
jgi:hypothetical protein